MSIVDKNGKNATPGLPCIYQLITGQFFYTETAKEDSDSYVFDGDKTLIVTITPDPQEKGRADVRMQKISASEFAPKQVRVHKPSVIMVTDCGRPELVQKAKEALAGIVLAGPGVN